MWRLWRVGPQVLQGESSLGGWGQVSPQKCNLTWGLIENPGFRVFLMTSVQEKGICRTVALHIRHDLTWSQLFAVFLQYFAICCCWWGHAWSVFAVEEPYARAQWFAHWIPPLILLCESSHTCIQIQTWSNTLWGCQIRWSPFFTMWGSCVFIGSSTPAEARVNHKMQRVQDANNTQCVCFCCVVRHGSSMPPRKWDRKADRPIRVPGYPSVPSPLHTSLIADLSIH